MNAVPVSTWASGAGSELSMGIVGCVAWGDISSILITV